MTGRPFRFPIQWVNRPNLDFRGYAGTIATGTVRAGDRVRVLPSQRLSTIARIVTADGDLAAASAGQAVTLTLADEVDVSRGDVIVHEASVMRARKDAYEMSAKFRAEHNRKPIVEPRSAEDLPG